jgi:hypothetical protein
MRAAKLSREQLTAALERRNAGEEWDAIGPAFGLTGNALRKRLRRRQMRGRIEAQASEPQAGIAWTETAGGATLESGKSATIRTLDDLLAACRVDLSHWTVDRYTVNKWDSVMRDKDGEPLLTELFQVKAYLKPIVGAAAAAELVDSLIADMREHSPRYPAVNYPVIPDGSDRHMLELDPFDLHVGMLAWAAETGADYDSDIAVDLAERATARLIQLAAGFQFERVLIPLGHDFYHADRQVDGKGGQTTRGTQQDVDTRRGKMVKAGIKLAITLIDMARQVAPVEVVIVPGNHDGETMPMLGEVLAAWYRLDSDVTIRNDPTPRHYVRYGASLIGLTHGHEGKASDLPLIMATERSDFGQATFRLWRCGHLHRKGETISEHGGVRVCVAPSLAARDHWHAASGYGHLRSMEAHIWHRDQGPIGQFTASVPGLVAA